MCVVCDQMQAASAQGAPRGATAAISAGAAASAGGSGPSSQADKRVLPEGSGNPGRRILIKGASVHSVDPAVGDFDKADILIEGSKIKQIAPHIDATDAAIVDATGMIALPGFIDTHHHQFETALRGFLADAILVNDGKPHGVYNYFDYVLQKFTGLYTPDDVYISELVGSLSQLDAGVTTVMDVSQIHNTPEHSDAVIKALVDGGRRSVFGYFEGQGDKTKYPVDARRLHKQYFSSSDQLLTMVMGGEIYLPGYEESWKIGRELGLQIALHVVGTFGMAPTLDKLAADGMLGPDNIFIHMTGMTDYAWKVSADVGAHISLAVPIEMGMRHGTPPINKALKFGMQPSLSTDVECTLTADFFTQMRSCLTLQRMEVNEAALRNEENLPPLLTSRDVIRLATLEGAKGLRLDKKTGSLTPGKEADIILLDATALNVMPLNHVPGAVVTLMERCNVDSVMVGGKFRKWAGQMLDMDLAQLRTKLEASRDGLFERAGVKRDLFRQD